MADEAYQDRTEQPTPKRRTDAREKGRIARSRDLNAGLVLLTGLFLIAWWGPWMALRSASMIKTCLASLRPQSFNVSSLQLLLVNFAGLLAMLLAPVLAGLLLASILANYIQGGWIFSMQRITPDLSRIQLFAGLKRLFSGNSLVELAKSLSKVTLVAVVAYFSLAGQLPELLPLLHQDTGQVTAYLKSSTLQVSGRIVAALLLLGLLDYFYQRYRHEKSLRMTKQEVKDEMRQAEGDARVKARIRSLMRQMATKRMLTEVPAADVVITNPTHVAVALKYDSTVMLAPRVVAKGQGFIALKIIALAQEAGVPRVENQMLARALYRMVEVGNEIPISLYRAVAEVLAYIYGLKAQAGGGR
ncbi:MAG: flagellar biosynthesis protein FlhB [Deltaproteobacteria bacterium]|nr:flagellar biosynthesis protein FlhB [Deltaproteobacteria bacterium]